MRLNRALQLLLLCTASAGCTGQLVEPPGTSSHSNPNDPNNPNNPNNPNIPNNQIGGRTIPNLNIGR